MFERLVRLGYQPILLNEQRRMHSSISRFPNAKFYDGKVENALEDRDRPQVEGIRLDENVERDNRVYLVDMGAL